MTNLRAENHALRAELAAQQRQLEEAARWPGGRRPADAGGFLSNKKNEDDTFDVEAAVLTGASPSSSVCTVMRNPCLADATGNSLPEAEYASRCQ